MVDTMMRVVRFYGKTDIRLENIAVPKCGKNQVKVIYDRVTLNAYEKSNRLLIILFDRSGLHSSVFVERMWGALPSAKRSSFNRFFTTALLPPVKMV